MSKLFACNWVSHSKSTVNTSFLSKLFSNKNELKRNFSTIIQSSNGITSTVRTCAADNVLTIDCIKDKMHIRNVSNTVQNKQKSDIREEAQYKTHLKNRRRNDEERFQKYRVYFAKINFTIFSTLAFIVFYCWLDPEERKSASKKSPLAGEFVDLILGPLEEVKGIDKEDDSIENIKKN